MSSDDDPDRVSGEDASSGPDDDAAPESGVSRRAIITGGGLGIGGLVVGGAAGYFGRGSSTTKTVTESSVTEGPARTPAAALKALSPAEAGTLDAVVQRILPTDATGPGAKEANVVRYIDWSLAGDLSVFRAPYSDAIAAIDDYARHRHGAAFADLTAEQQDDVLENMESNAATGFTPNAKAVFDMIRGHTIEGMFGDPAHGGNVGSVGWKLIRFPGPRLTIDAHDQQLDVVPGNHLQSSYSLQPFKKTAVDR
jgi:gluconate 2-dehydrogenase gamma chain